MVRAGWVAGRRTNAAVALPDQILIAERLPLAVAPLLACLLVQQLGEGLRQPVSQRLCHDRVVVVVLLLKTRADRFNTNAARDRERAHVILEARGLWRNIIGQGAVELPLRLRRLLAERMKGHK